MLSKKDHLNQKYNRNISIQKSTKKHFVPVFTIFPTFSHLNTYHEVLNDCKNKNEDAHDEYLSCVV